MNAESAQAVADAIDGRAAARPLTLDERRLVRIARACAMVSVPGPSVAALQRIDARFRRFVEDEQPTSFGAWFGGWIGLGALRRPMVQRVAAGAVLLGALGSGGTAAAGVNPLDVIQDSLGLVGSIAVNLAPKGPSASVSLVEENTPTPTGATPEASGQVVPPATTTTGVDPAAPAEPGGVAGPARPEPELTATPGTEPGLSTTPGDANTPPTSTVPGNAHPTPTPTGSPAGVPTLPGGSDVPDGAVESPPAAVPTPTKEPGSTPTASPSLTSTVTPTPAPTGTPTPAPTATATPGFQTATYLAADAGSVRLRYTASELEFVSASPQPGWSWQLEGSDGTTFKVSFERPGEEVEFEARLVGGVPQITVVTDGASDDGHDSGGDN